MRHLILAALVVVPIAAASAESNHAILERVGRELGVRTQTRIAIDPELAPEKPPTVDSALPVGPALTALCRQLPDAEWRRLYLPKKLEGRPLTPARLAAIARSLGAEKHEIAIRNPEKRIVTWLRKSALGLSDLLSTEELNPEPVYLLYSTTSQSDGRSPEAQIADFQQQQLQMQAHGEYAGLAYGSMIQLMQHVPREQMEAFGGRILQASNPLWDRLTADQRGEMMDGSMKLLKQFAEAPKQGAAPPPPAAPRNHLIELRALAADLAKQKNVTVVLDPGMFILSTPVKPAAGSLDKGLDSLVHQCPGLVWRRVYVPTAERRDLGREKTLRALVSTVRAEEAIETGIIVEDPASGRFTASLKGTSAYAPEKAELEGAGLDSKPVYLLYQPLPLAGSGSLEEQYAGLQRKQIDLMTRMTPEQMGSALDQVVPQYQSADPSTRSGILGLPLIAGMMAVWFPRQAKERMQ